MIFWLLGNGDKAARHASTQFGAALVREGEPPKGGEDFVRGVRAYFGGVSGARVIDARNHSVGSGQSSRTYHVADVLLETKRGPAVLELAFDSPSLTYSSERVTNVYELAPRDVPDSALSDGEFEALAKAFVKRGGEPADSIKLDGAFIRDAATPVAAPAKVKRIVPDKAQKDAMTTMRCVQAAKGDIEKLQRCSR